MQKLNFYLVLLILLHPFINMGQVIQQDQFKDKKEIYISFKMDDHDLNKLSRLISIDKIEKDGTIKAYLNKKTYAQFLDYNLIFSLLPPPSDLHSNTRILHNSQDRTPDDWAFYPDYQTYLDMMYTFQLKFPDICEVFSFGTSNEGRELLMARISKKANLEEGKPKVLYTSSMHGNELVGFNLSLRFIDYLLENYSKDEEITTMIDELDIWINPLANPDGAYAGGNHSVQGSTRFNANGIDLNRNFPDPEDGIHPDANDWQIETLAFMKLAEENQFVLSANFHAGEDLINYPWDTWQELHVDTDWWDFIGREWADTVHLHAPEGYLTEFDNGVTNGYEWYSISGGRQDYMNYFHHCREFTLEISDVTLLPAHELDSYWEYHYRSLKNYLKQALYGLTGKVQDADTGTAIEAEIKLTGHDVNYSFVKSNKTTGMYYRPIFEGIYDMEISAPCYDTLYISDIGVTNLKSSYQNILLTEIGLKAAFSSQKQIIDQGKSTQFYDQSCGSPKAWTWTFEGGTPSNSTQNNPYITYYEPGIYNVSLEVSDQTSVLSNLKEKYILVAPQYGISDTIIQSCFAMFTDSQGDSINYGNLEDRIMTFFPSEENRFLTVKFLSFDLEDEKNCKYDWLKIFDGSDINSELIGTYCGNNIPEGIEANNSEGALTFQFHSDQSVNYNGWTALISCKKTVSNENTNKVSIQIFPSPVQDYFKIESDSKIYSIRIYSSSGHLEKVLGIDNNVFQFSANDLTQGIKFIEFSTEKGIVFKKICVGQ